MDNLKEDILKVSRELVRVKGINAVNMRTVANKSNISVGSIYNYFKSKDDLIIAVIESIWFDIFHSSDIFNYDNNYSFIDSVSYIFKSLEKGSKKYPNFFASHSSVIFVKNKNKGIETMKRMIKHIKDNLYNRIMNDKEIRKDAFNDSFTANHFIDTIFSFIIISMMKGNYDDFTIREIIKRTIY